MPGQIHILKGGKLPEHVPDEIAPTTCMTHGVFFKILYPLLKAV